MQISEILPRSTQGLQLCGICKSIQLCNCNTFTHMTAIKAVPLRMPLIRDENVQYSFIHVTSSSMTQSRHLRPSSSHFSSLLETPTCLSCFGPSVFPPPQSGKLADSHSMGHQEINYMYASNGGVLFVSEPGRDPSSEYSRLQTILASLSLYANGSIENMHSKWATQNGNMLLDSLFCW